MKKAFSMKGLILLMVVTLSCFVAVAQQSDKTKPGKHTKAIKMPDWAPAHHYDAQAHVYFPDYYTFYDPSRGGYLYWDNNTFTFSPNVPSFMQKADLRKTRIEILKGLSLDLHPETNYPYYMKTYPAADNGNNMVPVPGNPAGR